MPSMQLVRRRQKALGGLQPQLLRTQPFLQPMRRLRLPPGRSQQRWPRCSRSGRRRRLLHHRRELHAARATAMVR